MGDRKPNIKSLVRRQDVEGLLEATKYQEPAPTSAGTLTDLGVPVREDAILAIGTLAPEQGHKAITDGLRDPADRVRCAAVRVLHALHDVGDLAEALQWLPSDAGNSRTLASQAIVSLRKSVKPSVVADAVVHREDDDLLGEQDARLILALLNEERTATDQVLELLLTALGDERGIVADRAADLLVRLAPESIEPLVIELRTGSNPADAAYVLGRIGDPQILDVLVKALRHRDAGVRAESAAALAELQDPAAVKPLLRATRDKEHTVRSQARIALDRMGAIAVIEGVAELLRPVVREAVRSAIPQQEAEADGGTPPPPALGQVRSLRSNGRPPDIADSPPTRRRRMQ
jgi:HEAT repeat protein